MTEYEKAKYAEYSKELERIRKKLAEAESNYQCTGSASTYRTVHKYEALEDVYMLALGALSGNCRRCGSTERRVRTLLNKYKNDDLTVRSSAVRDDLIEICPEATIGGNHG
jgi:hypothetical protein